LEVKLLQNSNNEDGPSSEPSLNDPKVGRCLGALRSWDDICNLRPPVIKIRIMLFVTGEFEQEKQECVHVMLLVVSQNITLLF
jgi:hypothetical protein